LVQGIVLITVLIKYAALTGAITLVPVHGKGGPESGVGKLDEVVHQMNDELTRMVINPDVTTRSRGVMEKCTFCVQRTQSAKLTAKLENRPLRDGDVETACQQACPTDAIVFGNANDANTRITQVRQKNPQRSFYVLEQIHTLPNVTYLAKVRNTEEIIQKEHSDESAHAGENAPSAPKQHEPATETH
jgi:molybdopterin-containing oxidoreductase family iron-sulfur binding subunit